MAMAPLNLALGQPKSSGTSKWARILGGGLAGASFLPQLQDNKLAKDAMLSGGLGMLTTGSPWGATAAIPSAIMNLRGGGGGSSEGGMYGPGINEPVLPDEFGPESTAPGLSPGIPPGGSVSSGWETGQGPKSPAAPGRKSKWSPGTPPLTPGAPSGRPSLFGPPNTGGYKSPTVPDFYGSNKLPPLYGGAPAGERPGPTNVPPLFGPPNTGGYKSPGLPSSFLGAGSAQAALAQRPELSSIPTDDTYLPGSSPFGEEGPQAVPTWQANLEALGSPTLPRLPNAAGSVGFGGGVPPALTQWMRRQGGR